MGSCRAASLLLLAILAGCGRLRYEVLADGGIDADLADLDAPGLDAWSGADDAPPSDAHIDDATRDAATGDARDAGENDAGDASMLVVDAALDAPTLDAPLATSDAGRALTCFPGATRFDDVGRGTVAEPYLLCNLAQWRSFVLEGTRTASYRLEADLDITENLSSFAGTFDGGGHVLRGPPNPRPLFTGLTSATITNVRIERGMTGGASLDDMAVLVGSASGTIIRDVVIDNDVALAGRRRVGGLAGQCAGCTIENVAVHTGILSAEAQAGGIVGSANGSTIRRVTVSDVTVTLSGTFCPLRGGGVAGDATSTAISEARVNVIVQSAASGGYGGVTGDATETTTISDVEVHGQIFGADPACPVGGVTAILSSSSTVRRALVVAFVMEGGGLVGRTDATRVRIESSAYVGGGLAFPASIVVTCSPLAMVTDDHYLDGGGTPGMPLCTVIDLGHPTMDYFYEPTNAPFTVWDFATIWRPVPGFLPTLQATPAPP